MHVTYVKYLFQTFGIEYVTINYGNILSVPRNFPLCTGGV